MNETRVSVINAFVLGAAKGESSGPRKPTREILRHRCGKSVLVNSRTSLARLDYVDNSRVTRKEQKRKRAR